MKIKTTIISIAILIVSFLFAINTHADSKYVSELPKKLSKSSIAYGQWNACNFGDKKMKKTLQVDGNEVSVISYMAKMTSSLDILVLQEISTSDFGAKAVAKLADELNRTGSKWDYYVSDKTSGDGSERYAILWKTSVVSYIVRPTSGLMSELSELMDREPLHAHLKIKGKDIHIYSFHLVPTNKRPENEVKTIALNADLFEKNNSIASGDFNLGHKKLNPYFEDVLHLKHNIEGKTSLKSKEKNGEYLAKEYDNIYTGSAINVIDAGVYDFVQKIGDLEEARKVSDHLLAYIIFEIKQ